MSMFDSLQQTSLDAEDLEYQSVFSVRRVHISDSLMYLFFLCPKFQFQTLPSIL